MSTGVSLQEFQLLQAKLMELTDKNHELQAHIESLNGGSSKSSNNRKISKASNDDMGDFVTPGGGAGSGTINSMFNQSKGSATTLSNTATVMGAKMSGFLGKIKNQTAKVTATIRAGTGFNTVPVNDNNNDDDHDYHDEFDDFTSAQDQKPQNNIQSNQHQQKSQTLKLSNSSLNTSEPLESKLRIMQEENSKLQATIQQLKDQQIGQPQKDLLSLQDDQSHSKEDIKKLETQITLLNSQLSESKSTIDQLNLRNNQLSQSSKQQEQDWNQKFAIMQSSLNEKISSLSTQLQESKISFSELRDSSRGTIENLQSEIVNKETQIANLQSSLKALQGNSAAAEQMKDLNDRINDLTLQLSKKDEVLRTLNLETSRLSELSNQAQLNRILADKLQVQLSQVQEEKQQITRTLQNQISELTEQNLAVTLSSQKISSQVTEENSSLKEQLQRTREESQKQQAILQDSVETKSKALKSVESELQDVKSSLQIMTSKLHDAQNLNVALDGEISSLKDQVKKSTMAIDQVSSQRDQLSLQLESTQSQLIASVNDKKQAQDQISILERQNHELMNSNSVNQRNLANLEADLKSKETVLSSLNDRIQELERNNSNHEKVIDQKDGQITLHQREIQEKESELLLLKSQLNEKNETISVQNQRLDGVNAELEQVKSAFEKARHESEKAQQELIEKQSFLERELRATIESQQKQHTEAAQSLEAKIADSEKNLQNLKEALISANERADRSKADAEKALEEFKESSKINEKKNLQLIKDLKKQIVLLEKRDTTINGELGADEGDLDSVMNAKKVQDLNQEKKKLADQLRNLEENFQVLKADHEAKTKLIQDLITKEKESSQVTGSPMTNTSATPSTGGEISNGFLKMFGRGGNNGNIEVGQLRESNKKLQEAYEEAMIKNLKYREMIQTMNEEIDALRKKSPRK